jgi:hypothetical protein
MNDARANPTANVEPNRKVTGLSEGSSAAQHERREREDGQDLACAYSHRTSSAATSDLPGHNPANDPIACTSYGEVCRAPEPECRGDRTFAASADRPALTF